MDRHHILNNPDQYDPSMLGHPEPKPALMIVYHPEDAPKGMQMLVNDAERLLEKEGWVDTPEKFPNAKPKYADSAQARTAQLVDQAVKEELRERMNNAPGLFPEPIDPSLIKKAKTKAQLEDFIMFHQLAPSVDMQMTVHEMRSWAESLVSAHNDIKDKAAPAESED